MRRFPLPFVIAFIAALLFSALVAAAELERIPANPMAVVEERKAQKGQ